MISGTAPPKVPSAEIPVTEDELPLTERWAALALLALGVLFRFLYIWHFRIDSDEPQHLHVVWAWTQGLLPSSARAPRSFGRCARGNCPSGP